MQSKLKLKGKQQTTYDLERFRPHASQHRRILRPAHLALGYSFIQLFGIQYCILLYCALKVFFLRTTWYFGLGDIVINGLPEIIIQKCKGFQDANN